MAKAAAAGLDVGAILSGLNQPLPLVRFQLLVQKAAEICQEVKTLGNNLLGAIEKEDNEAIALLRARHELVILGLAEAVRYAQWQEAIKSREGLEKSLASAAQRYIYYERLLGRKESEIKIPQLDTFDDKTLKSLWEMNFSAVEPFVEARYIDVNIDQNPETLFLTGGRKISRYESLELELLASAQRDQWMAAGISETGFVHESYSPVRCGNSTQSDWVRI